MNNIVAVWQSLLKQGRERHDGQEEKRKSDTCSVKAMTETTEVAEQHGRQSRWSYPFLCVFEWLLGSPHPL